MKNLFLLSIFLLFSFPLLAETLSKSSSNKEVRSGFSDGPTGPNTQEKQEMTDNPDSMGGAPNVGTGMATGTGAGSRVGPDVEEGKVTAGAQEGSE